MPVVEVAEAQIAEETGKAADPGNTESPPGPRLASAHWKLHQVPIGKSDSQQRSAKRHAIVEHKLHDVEVRHCLQELGITNKRKDILRKEVARERLKNGKAAAEYQHEGGQRKQEPASGKQRFQN